MISNLRKAVRLPQPRTRGVDLSHPARSPLGTAVVNCAVYVDGVRQDGNHPADVAIRRVRESGSGFVWIGLHEPSEKEFAGIVELFGLHPLAVEDAVHAHQRPKLEHYDDSLFTVFKTVRYVDHDRLTDTSEVVETGEIMVFTGTDFVITVRHGGHGSLGPLREQLESVPEQLALGPVRRAARRRRPGRGRLPRCHRRRLGRYRRRRERGLLRTRQRRGGADLPAQA